MPKIDRVNPIVEANRRRVRGGTFHAAHQAANTKLESGELFDAIVQAAVKAALPGRQNAVNVKASLAPARRSALAACRRFTRRYA